ncbi:hypothetical protein [Cyanobium sp. Lug-B]|uniref:hypothetical protein n=1 Tax=Cyanobium sp. Lug-B TaxID=2823716 RepID=UPI0020CF2813|nr:hypothetical protein [Cyanobium sp. Lug-B]MCP9797435.1 hypothetical protein [Cyanobium sp. Lug-B]
MSSLKKSLADPDFLSQQRFTVPSKKANKTVPREPASVERIIRDAVGVRIYHSVFVYFVAQVEACLIDLLREVLIFDPRRLKCRVQGINHTQKVEVDFVINSASVQDAVARIVDMELANVFYAGPKAQLTYLEKVLGISLDDKLKLAWREIKATRDILVHNSGVINPVYLSKTDEAARGVVGECLVVDKVYFEKSATIMKSLVGQIVSQFQSELRQKNAEVVAS